MMKVNLKAVALAALVLMLGIPCPGSADYVIDDFRTIAFPGTWWRAAPLDFELEGQEFRPYQIFSYEGYTSKVPITDPDYMSTPQSLTVTETGLAGVLGGTRLATVTTNPNGNLNGNVNGCIYTTASYLGRTGLFSLNSGGMGLSSLELLYNRGDQGLNLDFSGGTRISVVFKPDHLGWGRESIMSLTLTDMADHTQTVSHVWNTIVYPTDYMEEVFLLSLFAEVDLHHIKSVALYYKGDSANDASFDYISTDAPVPLPDAVWLLGSGLSGLWLFRRRRN